MQIEQRIKKELEENPALEEGQEEEDINSVEEEDQFEETDKDQEEFTLDDYIEEDEIPEYRPSNRLLDPAFSSYYACATPRPRA